jgi:chemotaxis protein MotB
MSSIVPVESHPKWRRTMTPPRTIFALLALSVVAPGCVKSSTHRLTLDQLAQTEARAAGLDRQLADERRAHEETRTRMQAELAQVRAEMDRIQQALAAREQRITQLTDDVLNAENEANRLGTLLNQRGDEAALLRGRLESLAALEQEIRERNRIYEEVIGRFRSLIEGGQLSVSITRGRLAINLPQDILFESGSATIGREGRTTITEVARVLAGIADREFQVEGHTDNVPIATARFPSNWELAAARALSVIHLLQETGVRPENVSGAAFGEHRPVAENTEPAGRRLNRRIEIVMLPNLDVIAGAMPPAQ